VNQNPHLVQLVIALIVVGGGFIRWAATKLKEQAEQKRRADEVERRKLEVLRTGRDPGVLAEAATTPAQRQRDEAAARQQQDAARRQAQIEEFRRRQAERARQRMAQAEAPRTAPARPAAQVPPRPLPPIVTIPGSTGPTVPQRAPAPRPAPKSPQPRTRPAAPPPAPTRAAQAPVRAATPAPNPAPAPAPSPAAEALAVANPPRTAAEWRRAIVINEILSAPLADRSPDLRTPF
jgi:hypothetical protein